MFVNFNILNQLGSPAINSNTFANRPAAGQTGRLFVSTDTFEIYRDNGTTWDLIGGPGTSTITGTGTATQVAYFTSSQAIGSSANLFWDNTNTRLGVGTATPGYTIEANGDILAEAIYLDGATAGNGALYWTSDRVTVANYNAGGIVLIETNGGAAAATFGANYTATFTSGIGTNGFTGSTSYAALFNGSIGVGIATPSGLIHADGGASAARIILDADTGVARIFSFRTDNLPRWALRVDGTETGSNAGADFALRAYDDTGAFTFAPMSVTRATGKTSFQAQQTYTTGLARGNYFDYNLSVSAGGSFSSPNAITALGASLDLTLAGSATIPSGARSGLDAYNSIGFTNTGTLTHTQGTQIRAYSNITAGWAFNGSATGTITHLAGLRALFPDNTGSAVTVTNNYALLLNDQTANTGTVTYTNRWGVYQEGASDLNYMAANLLLGSTTNSGEKLQVTGTAFISSTLTALNFVASAGNNTTVFNAPNATTGWLQIAMNNTSGSTLLGVEGNTAGTLATNTTAFATVLRNYTATDLQIATNNIVRTTITSAGRISIGATTTITDNNLLNIQGSSATDNVGIILNKTNATAQIWGLVNTGPLDLYNYTSSTNTLRVTTGNNVLIGTTTDAGQKLQVNGTASFSNTVSISASVAATANATLLNLSNGSDGGVKINFSNSVASELASITAAVTGTGSGTDDGKLIFRTSLNATASDQLTISSSGAATFSNTITTAAPSGGTAGNWKLGSRVASSMAFDSTQYIEVDIGGTLYKLALATPA